MATRTDPQPPMEPFHQGDEPGAQQLLGVGDTANHQIGADQAGSWTAEHEQPSGMMDMVKRHPVATALGTAALAIATTAGALAPSVFGNHNKRARAEANIQPPAATATPLGVGEANTSPSPAEQPVASQQSQEANFLAPGQFDLSKTIPPETGVQYLNMNLDDGEPVRVAVVAPLDDPYATTNAVFNALAYYLSTGSSSALANLTPNSNPDIVNMLQTIYKNSGMAEDGIASRRYTFWAAPGSISCKWNADRTVLTVNGSIYSLGLNRDLNDTSKVPAYLGSWPNSDASFRFDNVTLVFDGQGDLTAGTVIDGPRIR